MFDLLLDSKSLYTLILKIWFVDYLLIGSYASALNSEFVNRWLLIKNYGLPKFNYVLLIPRPFTYAWRMLLRIHELLLLGFGPLDSLVNPDKP